jgi:hypothetical protein
MGNGISDFEIGFPLAHAQGCKAVRCATIITILEGSKSPDITVRSSPSVAMYHNLACICLDRGNGAAAANACIQAVLLSKEGVKVDRVITGHESNPYGPEIQVRRARMLMEHGFINSTVISRLASASVALGDRAGVRWLMDYERFYRCEPCEAASRLPLRKIADIFLESPAHYDEPADRAIRQASRYEHISTSSDRPEIAALATALRDASESFVAKMRGVNRDWHPFTASIPSKFKISAWGVISGRHGYHKPHIHTKAWASGVLYLVAPDCAEDPAARIGWLRVGPPPELKAAATPDWQERWIKPAPGQMVIMPAYFTHETLPMEHDEERICVAFDIAPITGAWIPEIRP